MINCPFGFQGGIRDVAFAIREILSTSDPSIFMRQSCSIPLCALK